MGSFSPWYLWTHMWGFTAHCVQITTPTDGTDTLCVSRVYAAFLALQHCYAILVENTPTFFDVPILVIMFAACLALLCGTFIWESWSAVTTDASEMQERLVSSATRPERKRGISASKAD